jgi:flagellar hook-associated protein FlgK
MTGMSTMVNQIQSDARSALTDTVSQINTLLPSLASINQKIVDGNSPGISAPSADLLDERDRLLSQLQKLVGGQSLINSDGTATQLVAGMPLVERAVANKVTINADQQHVALTFNLQNGPTKGVLQTVQSLDGGQAGALLELTNNFVPSVQKRLDTIAMGLVKVANSAAQTSPGLATSLAIFGFKVGDKTYSSLATNDLTGKLPTISNENDLLDLYSSLGNAIASDSGVKVGNAIGSYSKVSSLTAGPTTTAGDYTLTKVGTDQLQLSDGLGKSQIVSLTNSVSGGLQTVDFNQLGVTMQIANISPALSAVSSTSVIKAGATLPVGGTANQTISNMVVQNNVQSGAYTFTNSGDQLTLTSSNGGSQTITVGAGVASGQTLNFDQMGISFVVSDTGSPVKDAATIAGYLNSNVITLEKADDAKASIASALDGLKIKVSGMANPLVNYGLNAANFISLAPSNFASYFNGNTPLISSDKANATQQMSAVFGSSVSNLVNEVGVKVSTWKNNQKADTVVLSNLKAQRDSVSGVNLDEEAANLLKYQQLYTASTKVLQAGNQMFSTLLSIMN